MGGRGVKSPLSAEDDRQLRERNLYGRRILTIVPIESAVHGRMESVFHVANFLDACREERTLFSENLSGSLPVSNPKKGGDALAPMHLCLDCSDDTLQLITRTNCPVTIHNPEALNLTQSYHFCTFQNPCVATLRQVVS